MGFKTLTNGYLESIARHYKRRAEPSKLSPKNSLYRGQTNNRQQPPIFSKDKIYYQKTDILSIRNTLDNCNHPALLMIDSIACLGCDPMEMDEWGVDVMVAGCQKGLMVPPGMSFVFFNDKAQEYREKLKIVSIKTIFDVPTKSSIKIFNFKNNYYILKELINILIIKN